jgi:hypothetical protein
VPGIGNASEHIGEIALRVEAIKLGGLDQRIHGGGAMAAGIGAGEQIILAANGNRAVILPNSGRKLRSITAGTRCMGAGCGTSTSNGWPSAKSFMSSAARQSG